MVKSLCWVIVYKFFVEEVVIKFFDIELNVGRMGVIMLIVIFELVKVVGIMVLRVFFYNEDLIKEKDIWILDKVVVKKVGDIILEVVNVFVEQCIGEEKEFSMLMECFECGSEFVCIEGEVVFCCINFECLV